MTLYFIGAASGSALGTWAWNHNGWVLTCMFGLGLALMSGLLACLDSYLYQAKKT